MFEIRDVDLAGRIGRLYTPHGNIETPAFFPVIDIDRQELSPLEIKKLGFNQIITNAYLLYKRYRNKVIKKGLHNLLNFDGVIMTDSGAYQILHYGTDIKITQDEIIEYQKRIGTDIGVILDIPTGKVDRDRAEKTVYITLERAKKALKLIDNSNILWVLPIQGGKYLDLVEFSAKESRKLDKYSIYGIGSPTVFLERYEYDTVLKIVLSAKRNLQPGKPVHLFGAGHPLIIPYATALGIDTFDSASYILYARDNRIFTNFGVERIDRIRGFYHACKNMEYISTDWLIEQERRERIKLLATHNLCMINKYINITKTAINEGRLWELLEALSKHHPSLFDSFKTITESAGYLTLFSPRIKGIVRGLRVYDSLSVFNPRIIYFKNKIIKYKIKYNNEQIIKILPLPRDPDKCVHEENIYKIYFDNVLGPIPEELCGVYPSIHIHKPSTINIDQNIIFNNIKILKNILKNIKSKNSNVKIVININISLNLLNFLD